MRAKHIVATAGLLVTALAIDARANAADAAAWCAWYGPYTHDCGYHTFQQCLDTIHGVGGYCARNVYDPPADPPRRHKRARY
jgi:hypothetical protein